MFYCDLIWSGLARGADKMKSRRARGPNKGGGVWRLRHQSPSRQHTLILIRLRECKSTDVLIMSLHSFSESIWTTQLPRWWITPYESAGTHACTQPAAPPRQFHANSMPRRNQIKPRRPPQDERGCDLMGKVAFHGARLFHREHQRRLANCSFQPAIPSGFGF